MNQGLAAATRALRRVLQQRHRAPARVGATPARDRAAHPERGHRRARPHRGPQRGNVRDRAGHRDRGAPAVLGAAGRGRLRHARPRSSRASARGARSTRSRAARTSTSPSRCGSTTSTSSTTSGCSWTTSGKGSASRLDDWQALWAQQPPALPRQVDGRRGGAPPRRRATPERFARNRATAGGRGVDGASTSRPGTRPCPWTLPRWPGWSVRGGNERQATARRTPSGGSAPAGATLEDRLRRVLLSLRGSSGQNVRRIQLRLPSSNRS